MVHEYNQPLPDGYFVVKTRMEVFEELIFRHQYFVKEHESMRDDFVVEEREMNYQGFADMIEEE
jgi:hypothetical protein